MREQPRQASTPDRTHPAPAPSRRGVPIARGSDRALLERVVEALERAGVQYAIEDNVAGEVAGTWQVLVPITQAPRALAALAELRSSAAPQASPHGGQSSPQPGPLFESSRFDALRLILMLACFGAAAWLVARG